MVMDMDRRDERLTEYNPGSLDIARPNLARWKSSNLVTSIGRRKSVHMSECQVGRVGCTTNVRWSRTQYDMTACTYIRFNDQDEMHSDGVSFPNHGAIRSIPLDLDQ
jgi:hypothetical protein